MENFHLNNSVSQWMYGAFHDELTGVKAGRFAFTLYRGRYFASE